MTGKRCTACPVPYVSVWASRCASLSVVCVLFGILFAQRLHNCTGHQHHSPVWSQAPTCARQWTRCWRVSLCPRAAPQSAGATGGEAAGGTRSRNLLGGTPLQHRAPRLASDGTAKLCILLPATQQPQVAPRKGAGLVCYAAGQEMKHGRAVATWAHALWRTHSCARFHAHTARFGAYAVAVLSPRALMVPEMHWSMQCRCDCGDWALQLLRILRVVPSNRGSSRTAGANPMGAHRGREKASGAAPSRIDTWLYSGLAPAIGPHGTPWPAAPPAMTDAAAPQINTPVTRRFVHKTLEPLRQI